MFYKIINKLKKYKKINNTPKKICTCYNITKDDITNAINNGCNNINDVRKTTKAGTACGKCNSSIEYYVCKELKK